MLLLFTWRDRRTKFSRLNPRHLGEFAGDIHRTREGEVHAAVVFFSY